MSTYANGTGRAPRGTRGTRRARGMRTLAAVTGGALLLTTGGLVLAGCGAEQVNNAASTAPDGVKTFTSGDTAVSVTLGSKFVISLPETAGTGYQWKPSGGTAAGIYVDLFDDAFVADNPDLAGSSGVRNFTYDTAKAGSGTLTFELLPPGSTKPDNTESFDVTVK
ncbi:MAG: protease inhibitor I42 family protein [Actinobacteria bacterium]|nr:protease inhibitor I42 family protein [Actinomycetota bacterium]